MSDLKQQSDVVRDGQSTVVPASVPAAPDAGATTEVVQVPTAHAAPTQVPAVTQALPVSAKVAPAPQTEAAAKKPRRFFMFATGIECSCPLVGNGHRVDQLQNCGHYETWVAD
jgi:hypothetical protein